MSKRPVRKCPYCYGDRRARCFDGTVTVGDCQVCHGSGEHPDDAKDARIAELETGETQPMAAQSEKLGAEPLPDKLQKRLDAIRSARGRKVPWTEASKKHQRLLELRLVVKGTMNGVAYALLAEDCVAPEAQAEDPEFHPAQAAPESEG